MDWKKAVIPAVMFALALVVSFQVFLFTEVTDLRTRVVVIERSLEEHRDMDDDRHTKRDIEWMGVDTKLEQIQQNIAFIRGRMEASDTR